MILPNFISLGVFTVYMENSLRFEISFRSNLHRSQFHFTWTHVNENNEVTIHQGEILPQSEISVALLTLLFMFHLSSLSPQFIVQVSFLFPLFHSPSHSFHLPQSISFIFTLFGCIHITWSFNHIVSFTFQPITSLENNDLWVPLDTCLILDRYSLLEAGLRWFYYSLSLYIKQKKQHGVRRNVLVCSATDIYLFIRLRHILVNGKNI